MIEEILGGDDTSLLDLETSLQLVEALSELPFNQIAVIWYWLLGFTQDEIRFKIYPGRSRAYIWQTKSKALITLSNLITESEA